jgi:hypothetical protein
MGNTGAEINSRYRTDDDAGRGTGGFCYHAEDAAGRGTAGWCFRPDDDAVDAALTEADARELRHLEHVGGRADR